MTLGDLIYRYRTEHHMSQRAFAAKCGVSNVYISMLEKNMNPATGKPIVPTIIQLRAIADTMGYTLDDIMRMVDGDSVVALSEGVQRISAMTPRLVPMIGSVAAGEPIMAQQEYGVYVDSPVNADFALTVHGDSMVPTYYDGDTLYIRQQPTLDYDGQIAVVMTDDTAAVKHVYQRPEGLLVVSDNPAYPPELRRFADYPNLRILGKVCGFTRMYREDNH